MSHESHHIVDFLKDIPKQSKTESNFYTNLLENWMNVSDSDNDKLRKLLNIPSQQKLHPCIMPHSPEKFAGFLIEGDEKHYCIIVDPFYYGDNPKNIAFISNHQSIYKLHSLLKPPLVDPQQITEHNDFILSCLEKLKKEELEINSDIRLKTMFSIPREASVGTDEQGNLLVGPMYNNLCIEVNPFLVRKTKDESFSERNFATILWG